MNVLEIPPQRVLEALPKSRERAITPARLTVALGLDEDQQSRVREYLEEFARAGLATAKAGRYHRKQGHRLLIGTLRGTRSGHAFVVPDDERERSQGDVHVAEESLGSALHGDKVIVRVTATGARGRSGVVQSVLHRANLTVVGRFIRLKSECLVSPVEEKFLYEISIPPLETLGARDGDVVNVEITRSPIAGRLPRGRVIEVLGQEDTPGIDLEIIIRKHHLPHVFQDSVLAEADAIADSIPEDEAARRLDFRDILTITIDGETARDFDDAVSLEVLPSGRYLLGVHIADVSHYVRPGSALDEEAFRRGTSVYFPEKAIPMLPERLSNLICSLNPRVDRLTMSAIMELDARGKVVDYRLAPTIIRSSERMTYTAVNEIINKPEFGARKRDGEAQNAGTGAGNGETGAGTGEYGVRSGGSRVKEMLLKMHGLTEILIQRRQERGAIDFDLPEAELLFDDEGQIGGIVRSERNIAHRLIEEFMLLANETVATHLERLDVPAVYRIHEEPDPAKIEEFGEVAAGFGHKFSMHGPVPQRGFQHLLRQVEGRPEERMLSYLMLRSMERARYLPKNLGHFGLAMRTYTHFTSPIRRYPDLIVHRILREVLDSGSNLEDGAIDLGRRSSLTRVNSAIFSEDREQELRRALVGISYQSSERERLADAAEQELMDWRKAEFMAGHVGEDFTGVITSVKEYGFYVELDRYFVEGLVHISTLAGETFEYQPRKHRLVGSRTGVIFRLGDVIRVLVDRVDRVRHLIDFSVLH
jgi:ribonuclease R